MMAASPMAQASFPNNSPLEPYTAADHRRSKSYDPNQLEKIGEDSVVPHQQYHIPAAIPVASGVKLTRSRSLFRRGPAQVYIQGTLPPVPQAPIPQHSGKDASPLFRLEDRLLVRIANHFDIDELIQFSHTSKRCRAIVAKTLTVSLQQTVLKATLCQERKAVFSLEFIFQHFDPASMQAVFRASQLKSRRYFENSALARPVVQALTLVTPNGSHHPIFRLAGYDTSTSDSIPERELERATSLLTRPFDLDIADKGYYRVSPTTVCMVDTPFFPSLPLLDPLVPYALGGAHGSPSWEMLYKVDLQPPNYQQRVQHQQEKIYQDQVRLAREKGEKPPPPPPALTSPTSPTSPPTMGFVLPPIKSGPNLRSLLPDAMGDSKAGKVQRKPTVVRPPPEGWGPLPPVAPPPPVPTTLAHQLGVRTVGAGGEPLLSPIQASIKSPLSPRSPKSHPVATAPSCLEPELAEETERFLTLLFIQFPVQTLFPLTAAQAERNNNGGIVSSLSRLGRSLTLKMN
jgi:hypothetical protein